MDFALTEEQLMIQRLARDFAVQEIEPLAVQIDKEDKVPVPLSKKMADLGFFGMTIPHKYGGTEVGDLACILALEQLGYAGCGAWWLAGMNNSVVECVYKFGTEEQRMKYLSELGNGKIQFSIMFTEPDTGSDPKALKTTAVPDGDDYIINGNKRFITFGARDGYATVYAKDETGNCTCFIVEKNCPGYSTDKTWELMGSGGVESTDIYFDNMRVPKANILGEKGKGFNILLSWVSSEKIEQCAVNTGMAQAALDEAVKYCKERMVRGKPLSEMQGIQWMLGEIKAKLEACRWMTYRAAYLQEQDAPNWIVEAATAKLFVIPTSIELVESARRLHGAYGYSREFKVERLARAITGAATIATSLEINRSIVGASLVR
jgi:alkylation response protein AidB-like acyl-CoA dehydrogenase